MSKDARRKDGYSSWCKDCRKVSSRNWGVKYPEKKLARDKIKSEQQRSLSQDKRRDYMLKHRYGINQEDYDNLLESQNYKCAICKRDSREMAYFLHVDHCHENGHVRGLLCSPCNVFLGIMKDDVSLISNAITYLTKERKE